LEAAKIAVQLELAEQLSSISAHKGQLQQVMRGRSSRKTPIVGMCDEPTHDLGAFFDRAEPTGTSLVAGGHIGLEQEVMRICLARP
jgi:hypothetical protein